MQYIDDFFVIFLTITVSAAVAEPIATDCPAKEAAQLNDNQKKNLMNHFGERALRQFIFSTDISTVLPGTEEGVADEWSGWNF